MPRFLKVEGESVWLNLDHLAGLMVRAQLRPVGTPRCADVLETLYEATGAFEVAVFFREPNPQPEAGLPGTTQTGPLQTPYVLPVRVVATREEGETFIRNLLGPLLLETLLLETLPLETQSVKTQSAEKRSAASHWWAIQPLQPTELVSA
ncbi:hypothetical protein ACFFLM_11295 [Deinococcus oregonensis]|uniref:Uncharacterized protein n=1 Tax=Deinococcus oregonensis TaxID=1805970 RepID=A0ABV6AYG9_9DEIO